MNTNGDSDIRVRRVSREYDEPVVFDGPDARNGRSDRAPARREYRETTPFFKTTEFLVLVAGTLALLIAGYAGDDSLNVWRTWALVTALGSAYLISRGLAKAGTADRD